MYIQQVLLNMVNNKVKIDYFSGNLTLTLNTEEESGVLVYYGDNEHLAVELYHGRVKISFFVGNYPASYMYSYVTGKLLSYSS